MKNLLSRLLSAFGRSKGPEVETEDVVRAFHDAVHEGNIERVRELLAQQPALARSVGEYEFQPIHLMDMYFEPEILDLLLECGADINARNDEGVTLLHIITEPDAIALLVGKGADLEARDVRGWTPLLMQAGEQQNGPEVVEELLIHGANVNAVGNRGETVLSIAREAEDDALIGLLLDHGAKEERDATS